MTKHNFSNINSHLFFFVCSIRGKLHDNSGEFTLLDLGIDARHFSIDPESSELENYNTDVVVNGEIDEDDLLEIAKYM